MAHVLVCRIVLGATGVVRRRWALVEQLHVHRVVVVHAHIRARHVYALDAMLLHTHATRTIRLLPR